MSTPKYDPEELAKYDLTEEDVDAVRRGMEQIDRGETVDGKASHDELMTKLEEMKWN